MSIYGTARRWPRLHATSDEARGRRRDQSVEEIGVMSDGGRGKIGERRARPIESHQRNEKMTISGDSAVTRAVGRCLGRQRARRREGDGTTPLESRSVSIYGCGGPPELHTCTIRDQTPDVSLTLGPLFDDIPPVYFEPSTRSPARVVTLSNRSVQIRVSLTRPPSPSRLDVLGPPPLRPTQCVPPDVVRPACRARRHILDVRPLGGVQR